MKTHVHHYYMSPNILDCVVVEFPDDADIVTKHNIITEAMKDKRPYPIDPLEEVFGKKEERLNLGFGIGDKVVLNGCPYDEQIASEAMKYAERKDVVQIITGVKDTSDMEGTSGQWVKTDLESDWIDSAWFQPEN